MSLAVLALSVNVRFDRWRASICLFVRSDLVNCVGAMILIALGIWLVRLALLLSLCGHRHKIL